MVTSWFCCRLKFAITTLALSLLCLTLPVLAQLPTGTILGTVKDPSGAVVAAANVTVRNTETGYSRSLSTETDGSYRFTALPLGNYELDVTEQGFSKESRTGLTLTVGQEAVVNITLIVGSASQTVRVTEEAPQVDTTGSSLGGLVSEQKIAELPLNGRNYLDLTALQTGVSSVGSTEGQVRGLGGDVFTADGAPMRSNNYLLDGAIMQNFYGMNPQSVAKTSLGVDGIKEYKVITNLYPADYGMTMGSQSTIVSRGGTNQFHGDAFEFIRNSALDAKNLFDQAAIPRFQRNQYGGSFGGPIRKDKTFFFGVFEGLSENLGLTQVDSVLAAGCHGPAGAVVWNGIGTQPAGSVGPCLQLGTDPQGNGSSNSVMIAPVIAPLLDIIPLPGPTADFVSGNQYTFPAQQTTREHYGQIRVDHNLSASDLFFARYTIDDATQSQPNHFPTIKNSLTSRSQYLTLSENHILSSSLINSFRASYSRTGFLTDSISTLNFPLIVGQSTGNFTIGGAFPNGYGPQGVTGLVRQNILTFSDDLFWNKGKHALKFGTLINKFGQGLTDNFFTSGNINFSNLATFLRGLYSNSSFTPGNADVNRYYRFTTLGFYVQDDIRVNPRLTLNLGLRYEFNTTPREMSGKEYAFRNFPTDTATTHGPIVQNDSFKNLSPRIGFAWDVLGDGKTSVRGGFGVYYDIANFASAMQQDSVGTPPLSFQGGSTFNTPQPLQLPLDVFFPVLPPYQNAQLSTIDYYSKQPYELQYSLTVERQLPASIALGISYVGSRGIHLWDSLEGNGAIPTAIINGQKFWDPFSPNYRRINPFWNDTSLFTTRGDSWYNSLQVSVTKRFTHGVQFQSSYTYGKLVDTPQGQTANQDAGTFSTTDPIDPRTDKGLSELDIKHQEKFNLLYHFPSVKSKNFIASTLLNGWWTGTIVTFQTGFAFSPVETQVQSDSLNNQTDRPDVVTADNVAAVRAGTYMRNGVLGGQNANAVPFDKNKVNLGSVNGWFNPNMFIPGPPGFLGNAPRGMLRGPGLRNWDISFNKDTKLPFFGEAGNLEFRAEFFNVLNHPNLGLPDPSTYSSGPNFMSEGVVDPNTVPSSLSSTSGSITSTAASPRQIQFSLKVEF